ncbi:hypothetical protein PTSG_11279 [Salpingoeca rosetta]|uniref:Uncharacterized protein n=1 Tax=Salpingoeca rosetta (strain ATCC 50818 / BSB-021) TaxID=946362 RepID=F2USY3_SALR5|nr:uncharacterized protein PTSG_11279 [Salpingoeca rosetta]EGD81242.1 hypothetical protein PTSG_11279 [Salpingoeca rosetta]|eukprot:XP_004987776.1 hypothetical protein PTSG_11279 [Salpingoeca rosetta]
MRLNAQSSSGIFPGAELACAAASDGVIERWQKGALGVQAAPHPRCRPYVIVPIVVPPATPPADTQMLDDYDVTALPNVPDIICQASRPGKEDDGGCSVVFFCPGLPNPSGTIAVVLDAFCFMTQAIRETRCKRQQHHQLTRTATECS